MLATYVSLVGAYPPSGRLKHAYHAHQLVDMVYLDAIEYVLT